VKGQKTTSCGGYYKNKTAAYVSAAREVSQSKFIAHFFCKASLAVKKMTAEVYT